MMMTMKMMIWPRYHIQRPSEKCPLNLEDKQEGLFLTNRMHLVVSAICPRRNSSEIEYDVLVLAQN